MKRDYTTCRTCSERGFASRIEGGTIYAYACTSEVVVYDDGKPERVIKACPDFGRAGRDGIILTRSEEK